ncbi:MAG: DUF2628 domain-containing protein [Oscillospiraceae bacterium]|nr:DUF2628 domain-containing protein [Oscillospiraceae bacterium]
MNEKYIDSSCQLCGKKLSETDDVVVCPVCGAPHHRSCYKSLGHCADEDRHFLNQEWESQETSQDSQKQDYFRCPRCSTPNPSENVFCEICGYPLSIAPQDAGGGNKALPFKKTGAPFESVGGQRQDPGEVPFDVYSSPYGGLDPEDEIEGVSAHELAIFIGSNSSSYYIPKFKSLEERRLKISWNASAFFFGALSLGFIYYLYRKMYAFAVPLLLLFLAYIVPIMYVAFGIDPVSLNLNNLTPFQTSMMNFASNMQIVNIGAAFLSGFFANFLYKNHVYGRIEKIREKNLPKEQYKPMLREKGGINYTVVIIAVIIIALSFVLLSLGHYYLKLLPLGPPS